MSSKRLFAAALVVTTALAVVVASIAIADSSKDAKKAGQPEFKLPPGWTQADMQACMLAGTPGKMHEHLAKSVGVWQGKTTMWMAPGAEPTTSDSTSTVTKIMDGRYTKCKMASEMPGMGPYNGLAIYGFDNVSQEFVSMWIDNHSTGMASGVGKLSADGKTITWKYNFNCPRTKKPAVLREIETLTGPDTKQIEMFATDPKSGKEYKMMKIELTRKEAVARAG